MGVACPTSAVSTPIWAVPGPGPIHPCRDEAAASSSGGGLAAMFEPPRGMLFQGSFEEAKASAQEKERWLVRAGWPLPQVATPRRPPSAQFCRRLRSSRSVLRPAWQRLRAAGVCCASLPAGRWPRAAGRSMLVPWSPCLFPFTDSVTCSVPSRPLPPPNTHRS